MRQLFRKPGRLAIVLPVMIGVFLLSASAASAATSITIGSRATLSARVLVTVPVTLTCGPFDQFLGTMGSNVTVTQAAGNGIATGTGTLGNDLVCDGAPQTLQVGVLAAPDSRPFHGGAAVATAFVTVTGIIGGQFVFESAQAGPQVISIRG